MRKLLWLGVKVLAGMVVMSHALIHLIMPGVWNGTSELLGLLGTGALNGAVDVLMVMTIFPYMAAAGGIVGVPVLRDIWPVAAAVGSISSLAMFTVMWSNLLPNSTGYAIGPMTSILILVLASHQHWKSPAQQGPAMDA